MKRVHCEAALGRIASEDQGFGWETAAAQVARPGPHWLYSACLNIR